MCLTGSRHPLSLPLSPPSPLPPSVHPFPGSDVWDINADTLGLYQRAKQLDLDWTRALWIGSESVSQHAADLAGYVGVSLTNVSLSPNFQALKDFWSSHSEASVLPGIELLGKNPFIAAAHDAAWALLLAVHHVVKAGGSVADGQAIRNALVNVSFIGASGEIAFNNDLDLKQGAYDVLAATSNAEGHTEIAARYRQGKLIVMDRDRLQARQVPSVDGRLCRMRCITPVYAGLQ